MSKAVEITPPSALKAAVYLRMSRDRTGEGLGVDRQREDCLELAAQLGWEVADLYIDNDISATSGKPRPEYRRMLADLDAGAANAIIAWHPDRLYRRAVDLGDLVDACKRNQAQVATVNAGTVDLTTPTGRLVAGLLAQVAVYEGEHKAERWARSWRQGREAGKPVRAKNRLFGYDHDSGIVEEEAKVAREMANQVATGVPYLTICRQLDADGVRTTAGSPWTPQGLKRYLENPRLAGWSTLDGEIVAEGQWEPILDRELWEEVRAVLGSRTRAHVPRVALLNGLLFCTCGMRMITSSQKGKRTYRCPNRPNMKGCGKVSGNAEPIEEIVESYAEERISDPFTRESLQAAAAQPSTEQNELSDLEIRITELEASLDETGVPVVTILRAIERAKDRQKDLMSKIADRATVVTLPRQGGEWPEDLRRRRALVDLVVERVVLRPWTGQGGRLGFDNSRVDVIPRELD